MILSTLYSFSPYGKLSRASWYHRSRHYIQWPFSKTWFTWVSGSRRRGTRLTRCYSVSWKGKE